MSTSPSYEKSGLELQVALSLRLELLEQRLFPKAPTLHPIASKPLPDFAYIHQELKKKGVTRELLWQQYREEHPDGYGITQLKEHYNRYAGVDVGIVEGAAGELHDYDHQKYGERDSPEKS